jgi:NAD(P)-dependent dehydrogenase (short-subunit alcohol dehydrogenase family)
MAKEISFEKSVLIVGGNSSLASPLIERATQDDFRVLATYKNRTRTVKNLSDDSMFELNLESRESIDSLLQSLGGVEFQRIYILIGKLSQQDPYNISYESLTNYFQVYGVNLCYLIDRLTTLLSKDIPSFLIFISSRAAISPSYDVMYSSTKACVTSFVRSRASFLHFNQIAVSVTSGLIIGSNMYREMSNQIDRHLELSGGQLLNVEQFTKELWNLDFESLKSRTSQVINIGPVY